MVRSGQVLVVVLLVLGVAVTVALSVVSRSVTEVSVSTAEDESTRALEAAEAGVERALGGVVAVGQPPFGETLQQSSFNVVNTAVGGGTTYEVPYTLEAGDVATVFLNNSNTSLTLCWGGSGMVPAVEVILYYQRSGVVRVGRGGYDPLNSRVRSNSFVYAGSMPGTCSAGLSGYSRGRAINLTDLGMPGSGTTPLMLRVRMLYNDAGVGWKLAIRASSALPQQGSEITSTGQAGSSTQKLRVVQSNLDLPLMFDAALFSGTDLVQVP